MKLVLYPHGGSGNHGCEAIVRSTVKLTGADSFLFSVHPHEDAVNKLPEVCHVLSERAPISRSSLSYWMAFVRYHLGDKDAYDRLAYRPIFAQAAQTDFALSIGGDNYCYGTPHFIYLINRQLRKQGVKTILWGCSVEPSCMEGEMLDDLKAYTHIMARESITFQALKDHGIEHVSLVPDPAFALNKQEVNLPEGFVEGNTVGINVSPMIINYEQSQGMTLKNYVTLIQYILDHTDCHIALIPHVVWEHNDDRQPLQQLYDRFCHTRRVVLLPDSPAEVLKGYIARCRFLVAARTHASIAAYSEQVPTLVVGYSVKARGIARDLFGTEDNYVIPVQSLQQETDLQHAFQWIYSHEADIRTHYQKVMPAYIERTRKAAELLKQV